MAVIGMSSPDWKYTETVQRTIRVIKVNQHERVLDAQNMDDGAVFTLDAAVGVDLGKIKRAKIYHATMKVYTAELSGDLERNLSELSLEDPQLRRSLDFLKLTGSKLKKFELLSIK
jgi:hypothetical protein